MTTSARTGTLQNADDRGVTADALVGERAGNVTAHQANAVRPGAVLHRPLHPTRHRRPLVEVLTCRYKNCRTADRLTAPTTANGTTREPQRTPRLHPHPVGHGRRRTPQRPARLLPQRSFLRTISMENHWPFYETRWNVAALDDNIALPADVDPSGIASLIDQTTGYRLMQIGNEVAEDSFVGLMVDVADNPTYYTIYGGSDHPVARPHPTTSPATTRCAANASPPTGSPAGPAPNRTATPASTNCSPTTPSPCATPNKKTKSSKTST